MRCRLNVDVDAGIRGSPGGWSWQLSSGDPSSFPGSYERKFTRFVCSCMTRSWISSHRTLASSWDRRPGNAELNALLRSRTPLGSAFWEGRRWFLQIIILYYITFSCIMLWWLDFWNVFIEKLLVEMGLKLKTVTKLWIILYFWSICIIFDLRKR